MNFIGLVPLGSGVGRTTLREVTVEWKICGFFSISDENIPYYESSAFSFADSQWCLRLYPNGQVKYSSVGWVDLYLVKEKDLGRPKTVHYTFGLKGSDGVDKCEEREETFSNTNCERGIHRCRSRTELNSRFFLLPENVLTVTCGLRRSKARSAVENEESLGESLLNVLESGDDNDIVIKVQEKEFPAHRVILRARSPVFRAMFRHDMEEKQKSVVTIEDCDPDVFSDFLVHIYSGSCKNITTKNVSGLYTVADKYDIGELKEACKKFMRRYISVPCFCDIITVAVKHNEKELIACATAFFCDNYFEIIKTAEWKTFQKENATVGKKLLSRCYQNLLLVCGNHQGENND